MFEMGFKSRHTDRLQSEVMASSLKLWRSGLFSLHTNERQQRFQNPSYQLLFHVWRTSVSWMPCLSACSSRKSNMYLIARGRAVPRHTVLNRVSNRSSTNFCSVPCRKQHRELKLKWCLYSSWNTYISTGYWNLMELVEPLLLVALSGRSQTPSCCLALPLSGPRGRGSWPSATLWPHSPGQGSAWARGNVGCRGWWVWSGTVHPRLI